MTTLGKKTNGWIRIRVDNSEPDPAKQFGSDRNPDSQKEKKVASFRPLQKFLNAAVQFGLASANSLNKQLRNKLFIPFFIA